MSGTEDPAPASAPGVGAEDVAANVPADTADDQKIDVAQAADQGGLPESAGALAVKEETVLLLGVCFGSLITMIAGARHCDEMPNDKCEDEQAWAICVGLISLVFTLIVILLSKYAPAIHQKIDGVFAIILFIWWLCGVGAGTFKKPFKTTQNGYFAEWGCFFASGYYMILAWPRLSALFQTTQQRAANASSEQRYAILVALLSLVVMIQSAVECGDHDDCAGEYGYAVTASVISLFLMVIYVPCHGRLKAMKCGPASGTTILGYFMVLWWMAAAGTFTFDKPFLLTGNGYFGSWGCFVMSILFTMESSGHTGVEIRSSQSSMASSDAASPPAVDAPSSDAAGEVAPEIPEGDSMSKADENASA